MFQKKHEKSKIRSFRVPQTLDNFFKETFVNGKKSALTANDFFLDLIENSQEYKDYLRKQAEEEDKNQPTLF